MPASKKPRKAYRPTRRAPDALPMTYGLQEKHRVDLQLIPHGILETFRTGHGDEQTWHTLAAALNLGAVMSKKHPEEAQAVMSRSLDALTEVKARGDETGRWGMTGDQLRAVGEGLTLSNEIQDVSTRREVRDALEEVYRTAAY